MNPPIKDPNVRVCSHYFKEDNFIKKPKLEDFTHRPELNDDAVPTLFSFCTPDKCRKFNEARANKTEHRAIIDELLPGPSSISSPKPSIYYKEYRS